MFSMNTRVSVWLTNDTPEDDCILVETLKISKIYSLYWIYLVNTLTRPNNYNKYLTTTFNASKSKLLTDF